MKFKKGDLVMASNFHYDPTFDRKAVAVVKELPGKTNSYYRLEWSVNIDQKKLTLFEECELEHVTKLARHLAGIEVDIETETK
jgi:hypothetical protein